MGGIGDFLFGSEPEQQSQSSSSSGNYAYPSILAAYGPAMNYTAAGGNLLGSLLGVNTGGGTAPAPVSPTPADGGNSGGLLRDNGFDPETKQGLMARRRRRLDGEAATNPSSIVPTLTQPTYSATDQTDALTNFANSTGMQFIRDQGVKAIEGSQAGRGLFQSGATGQELVKFGQGLGSTYVNQFMDKLLDYARLGIGAGSLVAGAGGWSKSSGTSSGSGGKTGILPIAAAAAAASGGGG